ncbi:hypothetical protein [Sphingomonas jaspsi]|uniref:hypothetical protein n=1 Tax=Sphingomonas jaspsi TaxID=392409 RepID=UPI00146F9439|nr:hypothetical protein [Sphingomonas jaspsi]
MLQRKASMALMAVGLGAGITSALIGSPLDPGMPTKSALNTPFDAGLARDKGQAG